MCGGCDVNHLFHHHSSLQIRRSGVHQENSSGCSQPEETNLSMLKNWDECWLLYNLVNRTARVWSFVLMVYVEERKTNRRFIWLNFSHFVLPVLLASCTLPQRVTIPPLFALCLWGEITYIVGNEFKTAHSLPSPPICHTSTQEGEAVASWSPAFLVFLEQSPKRTLMGVEAGV